MLEALFSLFCIFLFLGGVISCLSEIFEESDYTMVRRRRLERLLNANQYLEYKMSGLKINEFIKQNTGIDMFALQDSIKARIDSDAGIHAAIDTAFINKPSTTLPTGYVVDALGNVVLSTHKCN